MIKSTVLQMFWRFLLPQRPARGGQQSSERGVFAREIYKPVFRSRAGGM